MDEPQFCACGCGAATRLATRNDARKGWTRGQPRRFLAGHNRRMQANRRPGLPSWATYTVTESGCWRYTGTVDPSGYAITGAKDVDEARVHRLLYRHLVGPIPAGLHLGHLCHDRDATCPGGRTCEHRRCINPAHLEPMTPSRNAQARWDRHRAHARHLQGAAS